MDALTELAGGFATALTPQNLLYAFIPGDDFSTFLADETERVEAVMSELGLV